MKKILWTLKQLFPFSYFSVYEADGKRYASYWRMWMGKVFSHRSFQISDG